jgi:glycoside/pentoside/hexuronide:cation symporter, GPH family
MTHKPVISPDHEDAAFSAGNGWRYGLLGLPLAFVALPLYVILPNHYAREFGMPLATLGLVLLLARLFDAFTDPLLGKLSDKLFARSAKAVLTFGGIAGVFLAAGFALLFFPPLTVRQQQPMLIAWAAAMLLITYAAYSALSIAHQSWGAMLGGTEAQRSRLVAWREGLGLIGVILASILPIAVGLIASTAIFIIAIIVAWMAWAQSVRPIPSSASFSSLTNTATHSATHSVFKPFKNAAFKRLLAVFVLNGIASAVPATLILFFVQDRLQAPKQMEAAFLGAYFVSAALAVPLWLRLIKRFGLAKSWLIGMVMSVLIFAWAMQLGNGDTTAFIVICALSGIALSADLTIPSALLAGVIADAGDRGRAEGAYFGWWNFATKLNLALAAGLTLPLLGLMGYAPGTQQPQALAALTIVYCLVPIAIKLVAALALYMLIIRTNQEKSVRVEPVETLRQAQGERG